MIVYPYSSPIILTPQLYTVYGGNPDGFSDYQLNAAFVIAEKRATNYIGTFLLPTIVTGTYPYNAQNFIVTDYGYVSQIKSATLKTIDNLQNCTLTDKTGCAFIFEDTFGYLNFSCVQSLCNCAGWQQPYQFQIAYEAGLPTGTASQADVVLALTVAAEIILNEIAYPRANESAGDIGVTQYSSMDYSETRKSLKTTVFGNSARANLAARLLDGAIRKARPYLGL